MFSSKLLTLTLALGSISSVLTQPNNTLIGLEAVKAHFAQSGLVPAVLSKFAPNALLSVSFKGLSGNIAAGQAISREQALNEPILSVMASNSSGGLQGTYTIMMVDAGPPGADQSRGQRLHWLLNGATIPVSANSDVSMAGATVVTEYIPPNPPVGNGPHRYALLVFAQPADFLPPADLSRPNTGGGIFAIEDYAKFSKLGDVIAGSYFTCQQGRKTATIPPTSAVVSETLAGWGAARPTGVTVQKTNSGLSATRSALALLLAPIMGILAL